MFSFLRKSSLTGYILIIIIGVLFVASLIYTTQDASSSIAHDLSQYWHHSENNTCSIDEEHGRGRKDITKAAIASAKKENEGEIAWIAKELPDWEPVVYILDGPGNFTLYKNAGREASVYLTYLINHYYSLPDYMVFIHGPRYQEHNDYPMFDTLPLIANLSLSYVDEEGYVPLRCAWEAGCPGPTMAPDINAEDDFFHHNHLYATAYMDIFPEQEVPARVAAPCCAQFALSKEMALSLPVTKYEQIRQYLWDRERSESTWKLGVIMEFMWHIIFGKPADWCDYSAADCYCKKYGLCDLDCPDRGSCKGRSRPSDIMPEGWPEKGQAEVFGEP